MTQRSSASPRIAIVILNWNGGKFLSQFLPSVVAFSPGCDLVVADNASTDGSRELLRRSFPAVRIIELDRNYGFAGGYNRALQQVEADYYILLNSDVEVTEGWVFPMTALLEGDPKIAACQPKILSHTQKDLFEYAGAAGGWLDRYGYPFSRGRVFEHCEMDRGQYDQPGPIFWASGACLCIRASVFHSAGRFDEYFFAHQEEIDLCWRLQLAGHEIHACPASVVYHVGGGTLPRGRSLKTYLNFRNNRIMMSKNLPLHTRLWLMPVRNFLDAVSAWKGLLSGDPGYFITVIRAQIGFVRWWLFHRRRSVFPVRRGMDLKGVFRGNIAWQYFVRKKRTFNEIVNKSS